MLVQSEIRIGIHPVLVNVEAFNFLVFANTYPDGFLQGQDDDKGGEATENPCGAYACQLVKELVCPGLVAEDTYGQGSPDTADKVNGYCTYGVIKTDPVYKGYAEDNDGTCQQADYHGFIGRHQVGPCRNTYQAAQDPVEEHGKIQVLCEDSRKDDGTDTPCRCGKAGGYKDQGGKGRR